MFVRFRERKNDGREPEHVLSRKKMCAGRCPKVPGKRCGPDRHMWGCPMRPRCPWRIGVDQGIALQPYRLFVSLVENHRVNGKVRQNHIADLGAIDGCLLSGFYAGVEPATVGAILTDAWRRSSIT